MTGTGRRIRRWFHHAPAVLRDPVLVGALLWTALAAVLFAVFAGRTDAQVGVFWVFQPPLDLMLVFASWRTARLATGAVRRFWLVLSVAAGLFTIGDSDQVVLTVVRPGTSSTTGDFVQTVCFALALAIVVIAMLVHPHPSRSGWERLAFWLDSATVLAAGAVIAWCFAVAPADVGHPNILGTLVVAGVSITAAFAAVKMILSGNAPMHLSAALPMIGSAVALSVGVFIAPDTAATLPAVVYLVRLLPSLLISAGARIQEIRAGLKPAPFGERRRKSYSLLPYGAIAIAFGAVVIVLPHGVDLRLWGVVVGLGMICTLVAGRQLVSFRDNATLITRLDTTLADLREHQVRLRHQALFDGLTGLANRTHLHEQAAEALAGGAPADGVPARGVSLLLIDLDGFKAVNDTLGHAAGDALLIGIADQLREVVRAGDLAARLGGDEFAVLLRDCAAGEAELTSQRILRALETPVLIAGVPVAVTASIGVADAGHGADVESLLHAADIAMYVSKNAGKGIWTRYDQAMNATRPAPSAVRAAPRS